MNYEENIQPRTSNAQQPVGGNGAALPGHLILLPSSGARETGAAGKAEAFGLATRCELGQLALRGGYHHNR